MIQGQGCSLIFMNWSESWGDVSSFSTTQFGRPIINWFIDHSCASKECESVSHNVSIIWICNEGAQMASLFHGPNSIVYYSARFLIGVSLWGTWSCLPRGRRTESIVVTWCWQIKSWDEIMASRQTDCYGPVVTHCQNAEVWCSFRLTAEEKHKSASPCSDLLTSHQQCTVNSAIQPHLSITTCLLTHSTTGVSSWLAGDLKSDMFIQSINVQNSSRCYVLLSSLAANALVLKHPVISIHMASMLIVQHPLSDIIKFILKFYFFIW